MENLNNNISSPLVNRSLDSIIAIVLSHHSPLALNTQVTVSQFLAHVSAVAKLLPDKQFAINLCENRYFFMVSFCAVIIKNQTNLLPPNKNIMTQQWLIEKYTDVYVLDDSSLGKSISFTSVIDLEQGLESLIPKHLRLNILDADFSNAEETSVIPNIPLNQLAAISFTSGSTGESKPNEKSWQAIVESSRINASNMLGERDELLYQLATVPPQHMWGLETSILLPLFGSICVADLKPLFPQDIFDALHALPIPRMLVSSPIHLRAMIKSSASSATDVPIVVDLTLCATSPLSKDLAEDIESLFSSKLSSAQLREVYGCSEIGSMAFRQTSKVDVWQLFNGINFSSRKNNKIVASTQYLPDEIEISDEIEMIDNYHFILKGRSSDMIDIAGKRGSLQEINNVLLKFSELIDGVIFIPKNNLNVERLAALVVLPDAIKVDAVKNYLKKHLDDAFVPRVITKVKSLPRQENGKLPIAQLKKFYQMLIKEK
jgi:acyl-coenzyme A synthetase/AMP-(fatty) acid ligase